MGGAGPWPVPEGLRAPYGAEQAPPHPSALLLVRAPLTRRCRLRTVGRGVQTQRTRSARRQKKQGAVSVQVLMHPRVPNPLQESLMWPLTRAQRLRGPIPRRRTCRAL
ncbi:hypothetical protein GCM10018773_57860 [Streptomyces candidus]|nr:hypothetical protein GCM10018773_57860 [Streptomyces candidus]